MSREQTGTSRVTDSLDSKPPIAYSSQINDRTSQLSSSPQAAAYFYSPATDWYWHCRA